MSNPTGKIKITAAVMLACVAMMGQAASVPSENFLCWTVKDAYNELQNVAVAFSYATMRIDGGAYLNVYDPSDGSNTGTPRAYAPANGSYSFGDGDIVFSGSFDNASVDTFMVELWDENKNRVAWQRYSLAAVQEHIWSSSSYAGGIGVTPLVVSNVVPEPAGGLLLIIGIGAIALRRRRNCGVVMALAIAFSGAAYAAQNDALITFSTKGPDVYADGSAVLDGECYALVWSTANTPVTFEADGGVKGGKLVLAAPVAKDGRCPKILFEVNADRYETELKSGTWSVYLLDTRRWDASGAVVPAGTVNGRVHSVNATGSVTGSSISVASGYMASKVVPSPVVAGAATAVPEGTPQPKISGIRVDGANVYITVKGTVPYLQYDLASGNTPDAVTEKANSPQVGADRQDDEIVLVTPVREGGAFFKVGRKQ